MRTKEAEVEKELDEREQISLSEQRVLPQSCCWLFQC